jgi:hypothetical protein
MSILNLNTPQGGNPGSNKKVKMWMGAGLLVAVLGIGSTFAANITLNTPEGNTEFGQGVTQTVYCGADDQLEEEFVTITPIAAYKNTVMNNGTPYVETLTATVKMLDGYGSNPEVTVSNPESFRVTINSRSTSLFPRWNITGSTSSMTGYWISKDKTTLTNDSGVIVPTATQIVAQDVYFVEEERFGNRSPYTYGYENAGTALSDYDFDPPRSVILAGAIPATSPTVSSEASFDLGGVKISNIPANCSGKNFVVSAYSETGTAKTLISGPISGSNVNITEIAALWRNTADATPTPSRDRTELRTASPLVTALEGTGSLKITFNQADGRTLMKAVDLYKLVVETQENALGLG